MPRGNNNQPGSSALVCFFFVNAQAAKTQTRNATNHHPPMKGEILGNVLHAFCVHITHVYIHFNSPRPCSCSWSYYVHVHG